MATIKWTARNPIYHAVTYIICHIFLFNFYPLVLSRSSFFFLLPRARLLLFVLLLLCTLLCNKFHKNCFSIQLMPHLMNASNLDDLLPKHVCAARPLFCAIMNVGAEGSAC